MKHYSFYRLFLSTLLLAIFGTLDISAQQRPSGPPVPKIMQLKDLGQRGDETEHGKMATRVSWAEDHQGGGKYGGLRAYGNGMESYYVK